VTQRSIDFADHLPVLQVNRIGGGSDDSNDFPVVSVEIYAKADYETPRAAVDLALAVRDFMKATRGVLVGGCLIDAVSADSGPVEIPYPNPPIQVARTVYSLTVRI
jgi:hypothetical protein